jgi:acetyl esterase/lipase
MIHETINLSDDGSVSLCTYVFDVYRRTMGITRPALIVCPGGGYARIGTSEGEPVAITFNQLGYNCFVLSYSLGERSAWPAPLDELSRAIALVRENADAWQVDPSRIAVVGMSAGAHLAGLMATHWDDADLAERLGMPGEAFRPTCCALGYAPAGGPGSFAELPQDRLRQVLGADGMGRMLTDDAPEADIVANIGPTTLPMFLWHSRRDELVPCENSLRIACAMQDAGRPYELHIIDAGHHAQSVDNRICQPLDNDRDPSIEAWVPLADHWFRSQMGLAI